MITAGDILAAMDVVEQLTNEIDDLTAEQAIGLRGEVEALQKKAKFCHELLTTRAVNALDGQPAIINGKVYAAKPTGKWRPDHVAIRDFIRAKALAYAVNRETGEISVGHAVGEAITLMYEAFVSPASMPKQGFLEKLEISNKQVAQWERGKKDLKVLTLEVAPDEDDD